MDIHILDKIMEQIEEATVQIDKKTTTGSRLALILVDNALELSMWDKINRYFIDNGNYEDYKNFLKKYEHFTNKTNFLVKESIITAKEKNVYDKCHSFRNEVYHQNIIRESIINDLAKIYLEACCNMIPKLFGPFYIIGHTKPAPKTLIKYGIIKDEIPSPIQPNKISETVSTFSNARVCNPIQFSQILALDINNRIEKVCDAINYIKSASLAPENFGTEQNLLKSCLRRANKLKNKNDTSNALDCYYNIDKDLISIEFSTFFIADMLSRETESRLEQYREDQYLEINGQ
jgi:hypothetical protein